MSSDQELIARDWTGGTWLYEKIREFWGSEIEQAFAPWVTNEEKSEW